MLGLRMFTVALVMPGRARTGCSFGSGDEIKRKASEQIKLRCSINGGVCGSFYRPRV